MSNGESPGLGGYPEMRKPGTRATKGFRGVWFSILVTQRNEFRKIQHVRKHLRALGKRRR